MGWGDFHLWAFYIGGDECMPAGPGGLPFDSGPKPQNLKKATLEQVTGGQKIKFRYVYDMGDDSKS
ncbi:MAG: hypothetical protein AB1513_01660 [Pseudomonadota bacterium]